MNKYYAVHSGRKPGVYKSWEETKQQVTGFKGAIYKRFVLLEEAIYYAKTGSLPTPPSQKRRSATGKSKSGNGLTSIIKGGKNLALAGDKGKSKSKSQSQNNQYTKYIAKYKELADVPSDTLVIYTDGSTINNGKINARGGYGAFFSDPDILPISEPLKGCKITNNVGELKAIISSLMKVASDKRKKIILSDSQYSVLALTKRYKKYQKNGWVTNYGGKQKPVSNSELIKTALSLLTKQNATIKHIYACHKNPKTVNELGNWIADRLANQVIPMKLFQKNDMVDDLCRDPLTPLTQLEAEAETEVDAVGTDSD